jgi:rhodanese-related sulfurtransferase
MKNILIAIVIISGLIWFVGYVSNTDPQIQGVQEIVATDNSLISKVNAEEFYTLTEDGNNKLLDIRTPEEFMAGHLKNAINIDYYASDFQNQLNKLDKAQTYLVYCRSGNRSSTAIQMMKTLGFKRVYELEGGINSWGASDLPICVNC